MGSEPDSESSSLLKLSLFSLQNQSPEHPGMSSPPTRAPASVPFLWEEVPGKPRTYAITSANTGSSRCLELPPRLLTEAIMANMPSPTTVLDGPYVGQFASCPSSIGRECHGSFRSGHEGGLIGARIHSKREVKGRGYFGAWGRRGLKGNRDVVEASISPCSSFSSLPPGLVGFGSDGGSTKVKITRLRRNGSFSSLAHSKSHLWASIYESFKQAVPWRGKKMKKDDLIMV